MPARAFFEEMVRNPTYNAVTTQNQYDREKRNEGFPLPPSLRQNRPQQFELDAALWYGAISLSPSCGTTIRKIFHLFYYAGVIYKTDDGWGDWSTIPNVNVASLLSHGGRVMIQLPPWPDGGRLWPWLNSPPGVIESRKFATHGMTARSKHADLMNGHRQYFDEDKGKGTALLHALSGRQHCFNVALGGEGMRNPFNPTNRNKDGYFQPVRRDGKNGHVFIHWLPAEVGHMGGMLIGCENAQSGKKNVNTLAGHDASGNAASISATGGKKWTQMESGPAREYAGLICDLSEPNGFMTTVLSRPLFEADWLDRQTNPVPHVIRAAARRA